MCAVTFEFKCIRTVQYIALINNELKYKSCLYIFHLTGYDSRTVERSCTFVNRENRFPSKYIFIINTTIIVIVTKLHLNYSLVS